MSTDAPVTSELAPLVPPEAAELVTFVFFPYHEDFLLHERVSCVVNVYVFPV